MRSLEAKRLDQLRDGLLRVGHCVANRPLIDVNLVVIATLGRLISPKVNLVVVLRDELEAEGLVPAQREDIE